MFIVQLWGVFLPLLSLLHFLYPKIIGSCTKSKLGADSKRGIFHVKKVYMRIVIDL